MLDLSIIILNFNTKELTLKCLESIFKAKINANFEVIVVDNHSADDSVKEIKTHFPKVKIITSDINRGFAGGNNLALSQVKSEFSLLLNSDTEVEVGSIDSLISEARKFQFGITSCKLKNLDGSFQPNAGQLPTLMPVFFWLSGLDDILKQVSILSYQERSSNYYSGTREVGWVSGAVMLINNEVCKKIGFLDDKIFMYGEDVEFCLKARRAGFKVGWTETAEITHLGGGSFNQPKFNQWAGEFRGLLYIYKKYYGNLAALGLKVLFYIFIILRILAFLFLGRLNYAKTYAKVIIAI